MDDPLAGPGMSVARAKSVAALERSVRKLTERIERLEERAASNSSVNDALRDIRHEAMTIVRRETIRMLAQFEVEREIERTIGHE